LLCHTRFPNLRGIERLDTRWPEKKTSRARYFKDSREKFSGWAKESALPHKLTSAAAISFLAFRRVQIVDSTTADPVMNLSLAVL